MLKQSFIYLLLSILLVTFAKYFQWLLAHIDKVYNFANLKLTPIFNYGGLGTDLRKTLLLVLIPIAITAVPALSYQVIKGKHMPYLIESTWCVWLVIVMSIILIP
ncbi:MAG: hypothetical protein H0U73_07740 [Tatlockia sp.]|nr:hypothetical protein [Tatlockia sp.]